MLAKHNLLARSSIAFGAATALLALPVFMRIDTLESPIELARLIAFLQLIPAAAVFLFLAVADRLSRFGAEVFRAGLAATTLLSVLRLIQVDAERDLGFGIPVPPFVLKGAVALVTISGVIAIALRARWALDRLLITVAPAFVLTTAVFGYQGLSVGGSQVPATRTADDTVIVIVFDELGRDVLLRDGLIDATLFPNLRALADAGVFVADATTNYGETCEAIPALFTGRLVDQDYCRKYIMRDSPGVVRDLAARYAVSVYGEYFRDCIQRDAELCHGPSALAARYPHKILIHHYLPLSIREGPLAALFGRVHPFTHELWAEFIDDVNPNEAIGRAYVVHMMLPHSPFALDEHGQLHGSPWQYFYRGPDSDERVYENYRLQVRYVDNLVGTLLHRLHETGLYRKSTIIVTGDHGPRALHPVASELDGVAAEAPNVPLIIRSPALTAIRVGPGYEHVDFADTLRDLLALPRTESEGRSIFGERPERQRTFRWAGHTYVFEGKWRLKSD